jgi:hypothetical protein
VLLSHAFLQAQNQATVSVRSQHASVACDRTSLGVATATLYTPSHRPGLHVHDASGKHSLTDVFCAIVHSQPALDLIFSPLALLCEQVLALLWAFLLNAASSVALDISGLAARHALDFTLDVSLVRAFATFYVVYGTFRVSAERYCSYSVYTQHCSASPACSANV